MNYLFADRSSDPRWQRMCERLLRKLRGKGICDEAVLDAIRAVPRQRFLQKPLRKYAYVDRALPIACGQTISQPYIVALMASALQLQPDDRVLDIGTGSGYAAAIMSRIVEKVYSVERDSFLAKQARQLFSDLQYPNIDVKHADGTDGWPDHAPFDAISVAAATPELPTHLANQLTIGGRLVIPLGEYDGVQILTKIVRTSLTDLTYDSLGEVRFVPFVHDN